MIAVGNNELGKELGKTAKCPACSRELDIQSTGPLNKVKCSCGEGKVYLIGMNGREINQSTPDHTEDKLDKVEDQSPDHSIQMHNKLLHDFAMRIIIANDDYCMDAIKTAYDIAQTVLRIGMEYEWQEYNGIDSLTSKNTEDKV